MELGISPSLLHILLEHLFLLEVLVTGLDHALLFDIFASTHESNFYFQKLTFGIYRLRGEGELGFLELGLKA